MLRDKLLQIKEGMTIVDNMGEKVGTVDKIQYSDENPDHPGPETATAKNSNLSGRDSWVDDLAHVFSTEKDIPHELKARFLHEGYIRIDASGIFSGERYVTLNQVKDVTKEQVVLNIVKDEVPSL